MKMQQADNMATAEDSEFELVLGNKQLLSVFAIVVVLLGVFFTMGYVVGRNSGPVDAGLSRRQPDYVRNDAPSAMGQRPSAKAEEAPTLPGTSQPADQPAAQPEGAETAGQATGAEAGDSRPGETKGGARTLVVPAAGMMNPQAGELYLQVWAGAKGEADTLSQILRQKGFQAGTAPGPNETLYRVLVGPEPTTADLARTKTELDSAGFNKSFVKKY